MKALRFYLLLPILYSVSLLPFWVLYRISDFLNWLLFRVIGYRKAVIAQNLAHSFPEKTEVERAAIAKNFAEYFCDTLVETVKMLTISQRSFLQRCYFDDLTLFEKYHTQGQNLIVAMGHFGNWEWGNYAMSLSSPYQLYAVYKPLQDRHFDRFVYNMRARFGALPVAKNAIFRLMVKERDTLSVTAMIADQTPIKENAYWVDFLGQDTAVYIGTEKVAKKLNYPVLFASIRRVKRGHYRIGLEELFAQPKHTEEGEITQKHTAVLEREIRAMPHTWLWSHKRWKHKRPVQP